MTEATDPVNIYEGTPTTSSVLAYTVPAGYEVTITAVTAVNVTGTAATVRVDRVPSGGTDGTTLEIVNESVAANSTVSPAAGHVLGAGDKIYVSQGTSAAVDLTITGQLSIA